MRKPLLFALVPLVLAALVFAPVLGASFLLWDDNINTYHNPWYLPVTAENTLKFWLHTYNNTYRPLVHTAWAAIAWLAHSNQLLHVPGDGDTSFDAGIFHAVNLALHLLNTSLVHQLTRRFVRNEWAAMGGTLLFALHPLQVESVAWVTGFNELLCATFCLVSLRAYLNSLPSSTKPDSSPAASHSPYSRAYFMAFGAYLLALLVKPAAVALPLVLCCFALLAAGQSWARTWKPLLPWVVTGALWSVVTALAHPDDYAGRATALWTRPFIAGDALAFYLQKLALPMGLAIDYGRKPDAVLQHGSIWFMWLVPVLAGWLCWRTRRNTEWPWLAYLCALCWLLPVCGLKPFHFQLVYSTVADRYLYFVLVPAAIAVAAFLERQPRLPLLTGYFVLAGVWSLLSFWQARTWQDNFSVFSQTLRVNPQSWMAHANLGAAYDNERRPEEAKPHFEAALQIKPDLWQMHVKLGRYAQAAGQTSLAQEHWAAAKELNPKLASSDLLPGGNHPDEKRPTNHEDVGN